MCVFWCEIVKKRFLVERNEKINSNHHVSACAVVAMICLCMLMKI